jgi:hypothetical protein
VTADREILLLEKVEDVEILTPTQLGEKLGMEA